MKLKWLWPPQTGYLFVIALFLAAVGVVALRNNNLHMVQLREDVFVEDKNNGAISQRLDDLRNYIYKHMNTSTGVELKYTYERQAETAIAAAAKNKPKDFDIFDGLPASCSSSRSFSNITEPCVRAHINKRLKELDADNPKPVELPDKRLYIYSFKAPIFSFDLAGVSLLSSAVLAVTGTTVVVIRFLRNEIAFYRGDIDGL